VTEGLPPNVDYEYLGNLSVALSPYQLAAVGSYASVSGQPSFFAFAQISGDFGGPPGLFVTGFMGGFGYNSDLTVPTVDKVAQFPFVAGIDDPSVFGGSSPSPSQVLATLSGAAGQTAWVTPVVGEDWAAAGITFSSFELVLGRALLVATFGNDFEVALLGLASMSLPQGETTEAYAFIELELEAVLAPQQGIFTVAASLTPNSYLFTPACRLTGGFAFCLWFGDPACDPHSGDFVVTVGGYHPAFSPPAWYPQPSAVGFNWPVDNNLVVKGGAYFALTPSAVMAGGNLEVLFQSGDLRAWFTAYANLLVRWKPFAFVASIGVSVGASYKLNLAFTVKTVSVELGATLSLWGPPTAGTVSIDWYIISFSISFGSGSPSSTGTVLDWDGFATLLPGGNSATSASTQAGAAASAGTSSSGPVVLGLNITGGLTRQDSSGNWLVRADGLSFIARSAVPATEVVANTTSIQATTTLINIRPMSISDATSTLTLTLKDANDQNVALDGWSVIAVTSNLPEALWGAPLAADQTPSAAATVLPGLLTGLQWTAPPAQEGASIGPFSPTNLVDALGSGYLPLTPASAQDPLPVPVVESDALSIVMSTLGQQSTLSANAALAAALDQMQVGPPTTGALTQLAQDAGCLFTQAPMIVPCNS
jgi:hypothetical protein